MSAPMVSEDNGLPQRYLILAAVATGYVSIMLAVSPVSVSLPTLAVALRIDVTEASWIMTAYLLTLTAALLPAGRLGDLIGYKPVFVVGLILSVVASALTGFAGDVRTIIGLRALQGIGAALISGTTLAILTASFSTRERGRVIGFATVAAALGAGGGTVLTPLVMDYLSWHGVFWFVVPIGLASLLLAVRMPEPPRAPGRQPIDIPGALLLAASLFTLAISFNHLHGGPETFEAGWVFHTGAQIAALVLFVAFLVVERLSPAPLIRLEHLRNLRFGAAVGANGVFHMTMMATMFLTPFLFERAWGLTTVHSSIVVGLLQAVNLTSALLAGWVVDRWRWPYVPAVALAGIAGSMLLLGFLGQHLTYEVYLGVTVLLGASSGFFNTSNNTVIMSILPDDARGFAAGTLETTRQFGHTIAVSLAAAAMGLAGVSLRGVGSPDAMLGGFQLAEIIMGSIAAVGVLLAAAGRLPFPQRTTPPAVEERTALTAVSVLKAPLS